MWHISWYFYFSSIFHSFFFVATYGKTKIALLLLTNIDGRLKQTLASFCFRLPSRAIISHNKRDRLPMHIRRCVQTAWMSVITYPEVRNTLNIYLFIFLCLGFFLLLLFLFVRLCAQRFTLSHRNWNRPKCSAKLTQWKRLQWRWWR